MNQLELLIDKTLKDTKGYISPITETLLWDYSYKICKIDHTDFTKILENAISTYDETIKCTNCGSPHPAVHRICDSCSYRIPNDENSLLNLDNLISDMEESLAGIKTFPKPSVYSIMKLQTHVLFPILTLYSLSLAFLVSRSDSEFFAIIFPFTLLFAFLSLVAFRFRKKRKEDFDFNRRFLLMKFQKNSVLANRHFGKDEKVKQLLENYTQMICEQDKQEKLRPKKKMLGYIVFAALLVTILIIVPKKTYSEIEVDKSKEMIGELIKLNSYQLILKPLQTNINGNFSTFLEVDAAADTFTIEVRPLSGIRPEAYFSIRTAIQLKTKNRPPSLSEDNSRADLKLEILDENINPVFTTIHLSPTHFYMYYKPDFKIIPMEFIGVHSIKSSAEANYLFKQKSKIQNAKYFVVYGDFLNYSK